MGCLALLASISFMFLRSPEKKGESLVQHSLEVPVKKTTFKEDVKSVLDMLFCPKMRMLLPQVAWTGISIAIYTGFLMPTIVSTLHEDTEAR
jgi:hypothetical protein